MLPSGNLNSILQLMGMSFSSIRTCLGSIVFLDFSARRIDLHPPRIGGVRGHADDVHYRLEFHAVRYLVDHEDELLVAYLGGGHRGAGRPDENLPDTHEKPLPTEQKVAAGGRVLLDKHSGGYLCSLSSNAIMLWLERDPDSPAFS